MNISLTHIIKRSFSRGVKKVEKITKTLEPPKILFEQKYNIENQQKSLQKQDISHQQLNLFNRQIDLIGIPIKQNQDITSKNMNKLQELFLKSEKNEISLLAIDPSYHMSEKRSLSKQLRQQILFKGQDIDQEEFLKENPTYPQHTDELLLDLLPLDLQKSTDTEKARIIQKIQEGKDDDNLDGYFTSLFSNKETDFSTEGSQKKLNDLYESISTNILGVQELETQMYPMFIEASIMNLIGGKLTYLGQVPKVYQRLYMANSIDLQYLKQMFKEILKFSQKNKINNTEEFGKITPLIFSHTYSFINYYYMYYILQQLIQNQNCKNGITVYLKQDQVDPLKAVLLNYGDKGYKQNEIENEDDNDESLLEKHAILDVLFSDQLWEKSYIRDPFPYIQENYKKLNASDRQHISQMYSVNVRKYQSVAKEFLKSI